MAVDGAEAAAAAGAAAAKAPLKTTGAAADDDTWRLSGHPLIGARVATLHAASRGRDAAKELAVGTIVRWMPPGADPAEDPALFHMDHADGDGEDLEVAEVHEAVLRYAALTDDEVGGPLPRSARDPVEIACESCAESLLVSCAESLLVSCAESLLVSGASRAEPCR